MKHLIFLFFVAVLVGCGSTMVKPLNTGSAYAPVNEESGVGEVLYRLGRMDSFNASQREDAYKKMYDQCKGVYRIVEEWNDTESNASGFSQSSANLQGNNSHVSAHAQGNSVYIQDQTNYRHITFQCGR